jgi:sarcosine oxidase subunit alpha
MSAAAQNGSNPTTGQGEAVTFTFEGRTLKARRGQTVAAALLDNGVRILARSFKYHRPRGYTCGYGACNNCAMTVDGLPGVSACTTELQGGEVVHRERGWPNADHDLLRGADAMPRVLGARFQFRHLAHHPRVAHRVEKILGILAGAGVMASPDAAAARTTRRIEAARPDVLVVGGGLSGCQAALAAAEAGAKVMLVNRGPLGGRSNGRAGRPLGADAATVAAGQVRQNESIQVIDGTAIGRFEEELIPVVARDIRYEVTPSAMVIAAGSYELPLLFAGNDKPGVMLAGAARRLLHVERVSPGKRAVVVTDREDGYALAEELRRGGVGVAALVDLRPGGAGASTDPLRVFRDSQVERATGMRHLRSLVISSAGSTHRLQCDVAVVALGERPADELLLQSVARNGNATSSAVSTGAVALAESAVRTGGTAAEATWAVGSAAGWDAPDPDRAAAAGTAAAEHALGKGS